jgi:hypothetical protein
MKRYIGWGVGVVLIGGVVWLGFFMTNPKPVTESVSDAAKNIFFDAKWYEVLWMRWTAVDWILSLLAAGTAIAAAVQNAFSNHAQAQAQAAAQAAPTTARVDRLVMWFAALTIVATTLMRRSTRHSLRRDTDRGICCYRTGLWITVIARKRRQMNRPCLMFGTRRSEF